MKKTQITPYDVTEDMVQALRSEAWAHGDERLALVCDRALDACDATDADLDEVVQAINAARAMVDA